jgi:hypothetical protein
MCLLGSIFNDHKNIDSKVVTTGGVFGFHLYVFFL